MPKPRQLSLAAREGHRRLPGRPAAATLPASSFVGIPELERYIERAGKRFKWCANCQVAIHVDLWEQHHLAVVHPEKDR